jgi:NAD-dependent deacetylase
MAEGFLLGQDLRTRLACARSVLVLTGAGMSAESGIPTFRDARTGLWANDRPEELATPEAFERDPARVWTWYEERRRAVRAAQPHAGHYALVELEARVPRLTVVTQNVDGLHQRAGSARVLELHGNILRSKCHVSGRPISEEWLRESARKPPRSPYVPTGLARPDVVWFGEVLPRAALESAMAEAAGCDFCLSIGTTSLVQPAASLPLYALEHGAALVEINPDLTPLSPHAHQHVRDTASQALVTLVSELAAHRGDNDPGQDQGPRPPNATGTPR